VYFNFFTIAILIRSRLHFRVCKTSFAHPTHPAGTEFRALYDTVWFSEIQGQVGENACRGIRQAFSACYCSNCGIRALEAVFQESFGVFLR
jgi:hypothetical protein